MEGLELRDEGFRIEGLVLRHLSGFGCLEFRLQGSGTAVQG